MDIYDELGVQTFINAFRPMTRLGGATIPEPVTEAMRQAAQKNVCLTAMQAKVGEAIASMTNNQAAYVSCGAASGITLAVAACIAGTDPVLSARLPDTEGMENEVLIHACERGYKSDVAMRCAGATIVNFGDEAGAQEGDLRSAITDRTAAIFTHDKPHSGKLELERLVAIGREYQLPVLVDAAFSVPPRRTLWEHTRDTGADAVIVSGGKGLRGPQTTGLVLGKTWIVQACAFHGVPNDRIGRGMKVGKEELAGIYAAVKLFMQQNEEVEQERRERQLRHILSTVESMPGIHWRKLSTLRAVIGFDAAIYRFTPDEASQCLLDFSPSIYLQPWTEGLIVSTECLEEGMETVVSRQLKKLFGPASELRRV